MFCYDSKGFYVWYTADICCIILCATCQLTERGETSYLFRGGKTSRGEMSGGIWAVICPGGKCPVSWEYKRAISSSMWEVLPYRYRARYNNNNRISIAPYGRNFRGAMYDFYLSLRLTSFVVLYLKECIGLYRQTFWLSDRGITCFWAALPSQHSKGTPSACAEGVPLEK